MRQVQKFKGKLKEMNLAVLEVDVSECEDLALEKGVSAVPYFEVFGGDGKLMIGTGDFDAAVALLPEDVKTSAVPKEEAVAPKADAKKPPSKKPAPVPSAASDSGKPWERAEDVLKSAGSDDLSSLLAKLAAVRDFHEQRPLNVAYYPWWHTSWQHEQQSCDAASLAQRLQKSILKLYSSYLSEDGNAVDYRGIAQSPLFREYVEMTSALSRVDLSTLPDPERKAFFFLNLYNALCIHGTVVWPCAPRPSQRFFRKLQNLVRNRRTQIQLG